MASSHIAAYKSSNRIDPKLKRRLRRSEEWAAKREEEINKRRHLVLMSPCQELNVDLSMDSSLLETSLDKTPASKNVAALTDEATEVKPPTTKLRQNKRQLAETKAKEKNTKSSQANQERLKMLQKWKEERELLKKQEALKRAKNKPFIVSATFQSSDIKTNFERKWEQEQKKKTAKKQPTAPVAPATRQRAGATSAKPTLTTTTTSQRTTRQTANKQTRPTTAAPPIRAVTTRAAPVTKTSKPVASASTRAVSTRAVPSTTIKSQPVPPKKAPPKTTQTQPVRRSTRNSVKTIPDVLSAKTRGQKQKTEVEQPVLIETPLEDKKEEQITETLDAPTKKAVSFAPADFVFTAPNFQSFELSPFSRSTLSPASTHSFFYDDSRSSYSPEANTFVTTRDYFSKAKPETGSSTLGKDFGNGESLKKAQKPSLSPPPPPQDIPCESVADEKKSDNDLSLKNSQQISTPTPASSENHETELEKLVHDDNCTVEKSATADISKDLSAVNNSPPKTIVPVFRTPVSAVPKTRRMRRSMSDNTSNIEVSPMGKRRRKTEMTRTPQSPEEWVELLRNSPMIEMTRKKFSKEKLENSPLTLKFTDDDLIAANIVPTKETSFNQDFNLDAQTLPEEISQPETELSDKNVSITESVLEKVAEVLPPSESSVALPSDPEPPVVAKTEDKKDEKPTNSQSTIIEHDVAYFRNLVKSETDSLNSLSDEFESIIPSVSEEVEGQIRTVIGQTNLLISKRFRQFIGLIDNCEYNTGEKETTCDDLQGFWDMVDFQVEDVKTKFADLSKSRTNNWQPLETKPLPVKKPVKKLVKKVNKPAPAKGAKSKGRSEFALFMAQKKKAKALAEAKVATPPSKTESDSASSLKVFDGLFFKIESPVKSPKPHCEAETAESPVVIPTFAETDRSVRLSSTISPIDIVENGEDLNVDSSKTVCPEKEPPQQEEVKSPHSSASPLTTAKSFRRSFIPAIPSPLLQDITPHKKSRRSRKSFVFTDSGGQKRTEVTPRQNSEMETDQEPTEKVLVLQTPPLRRSGRMRKSVTSYSPAVSKTPSQDDIMQSFIKSYLSSDSSLNGSQNSKDAVNSPELPVFSPLEDEDKTKKATPKPKSKRRKTVGSQPSNDVISSPVKSSEELLALTPLKDDCKNEKPTPRQTSRRRKSVGSQPSKNVIINSSVPMDEELPVLTPLKNDCNNEKPTPRQTGRRRKTVDSQPSNVSPNRRSSTRRSRKSVSISEDQQTINLKENVSQILVPIILHDNSEIKSKRETRKTKSVAFSDEVSTLANTDSPLAVLSPVSQNVAASEQKDVNKNGKFKKLNVNFTPVRGLKPNLTTTPRRTRRSTYLMTFSP